MNKKSISLYMFLLDITLDGGCERVVANMANQFINEYDDIHIISNFQKNQTIKYNINTNVKIHFLHPNQSSETWEETHLSSLIKKSGFLHNLTHSISFTSKIYKYINKTLHPASKAIVMFHGYQTAWYKKNSIKLIGVDHSNFPYFKEPLNTRFGKIKFRLTSFMNRKLDVVTALTNAEIEYWRMLKRPVYIMPNFIPDIPTTIPQYKHREKAIISMGRMNTDQKGFDRLISAFAKIAHQYPDWKVIIYGDGELKYEYRKLIDSLNLNEQIVLQPFVNDPYSVFLNNSVYAMCSRTEGFGMVLAEAMACGMAAISYENTGPNEIIQNRYSGFLIPNGDEKGFCQKLKYLLDNYSQRETFSINGRQNIIDRFSSRYIIKNWVNIFNSLCE